MTTPPAPPYQPPVPPAHPPRRVLRAVGVVWAVALLALAAWYSFHGRPSVREQTTVEQAHPVVDQAIAAVLAGAGGGPVAAISGFDRTGSCELTAARTGARYRRELWLYTTSGGEPALLTRVAASLPARYHAKPVRPATGLPPHLSADAGDYVALTGIVVQPGVVQVVADTGCRPVGVTPVADPTTAPRADQQELLQGLMIRLGTTVAGWSTHELRCGSATVRTIEAVSPPGAHAGPLDQALNGFGHPLLAAPGAYVTADGVAVRDTGSRLVVTTTSGSCAS